jgi:hypothetical protein
VKRTAFLLLLCSVACSSSAAKPAAPPPAGAAAQEAASARPAVSRTNPNVVEETETYYIERLPKSTYIKVDDRHVRNPVVTTPVEFFKEDDQYYYISVPKLVPEEIEAKRQQAEQAAPKGSSGSTPIPRRAAGPAVPLSDFEDLSPERVASTIRLEEVRSTSLPSRGMWRASFAIADVNGDGIPDIVAPPPRMSEGKLRVWLGDGKGAFKEWPLSFSENGKPLARFAFDYGGVAIGDIDGDGHMDIVSASHGGGLVCLFGDGSGGFEVVRTGLPKRDFSSQAVALVDADGDGRLDIVASRDIVDQEPNEPVDKMQVRVYIFLGRQKGWELRKEGVVGGFYSNSVTAWDFNGDGKQDILTGSHYTGALTLLWKSMGDGTFAPVSFPEIEAYSYHFATAPGILGTRRVSAFADSYLMQGSAPENARAAGITLYSFEEGKWTRHRLWRKKDPKSSVYGLAMGDLDGDGLDDLVFADSDMRRVRILFQRPDGSFVEMPEQEEPVLDSPGQCVRLADLDRDGRLDIVVSKTVVSARPNENGGWNVYLNRRK